MASAEGKEQKSRVRKAQSLPWIANPFMKHGHLHDYEPANNQLPHESSPTGPTVQEQLEEAEEIEEATPIELFYDLYFVANLTTVTSVHYITERSTLLSYCLYFIILWFTWLHVTLLDVRFSIDSVYERTCKGLHFGVMAAFASVSTQWDPFNPDTDVTLQALQTMTLTLMFSRFVLGLQYLVVMVFGIRGRPKTVLPLAIHGGTMLASGALYLGLYFSFGNGHNGKTHTVWYLMAIFEAVIVIATSSIWKSISFKKTHLVERMGLLTLIVLGEGIIVMLKAINTIVKGFGWSKSTFGVVFSALAIIYFFWMLYFDMKPTLTRFGLVRQQIWTILHFPFHLALVLSVEGLRQFSTLHNYYLMKDHLWAEYTNPDDAYALASIESTFKKFYYDSSAKSVLKDWPIITNWTELYGGLINGTIHMTTLPPNERYNSSRFSANGQEPTQQLKDKLWGIYLQTSLFQESSDCLSEFYGLKLPDRKYDPTTSQIQHGVERNTDHRKLFSLVYRYFFVSMGAVFLLYALFSILARRRMDVFDWVAIALRVVPAAIFFGFSAVMSDSTLYSNYKAGAWPLPQICVLIFLVLIADKVVNSFARKRG